VDELSEAERGQFLALEIVIDGEFTSFPDVGRALVRDAPDPGRQIAAQSGLKARRRG
jgi:hypothetical protein